MKFFRELVDRARVGLLKQVMTPDLLTPNETPPVVIVNSIMLETGVDELLQEDGFKILQE